MANKKVSQLVSKPSVLVTDLFPIADPTTGQLYKTTISDLGTAIGSGVSSVNTLVGAVVLDTDDIQELASPTNRWFTDTRARAALSATSPLAYNSGTGVFSIPQATGSQNGFLSSTDWTTFNAKQQALSGTGFVKISGTTISYDNSTYLTTSAAASTYLALAGGTLTGALNGTSATFTGDLTISSANPRIYLTDTNNNPDYFISNTDGTFTIYDVTNSTSRFTIGTTGNATFTNAITGGGSITGESIYSNGIVSVGTGLTVGTTISATGSITGASIIRSGGTSSQFLKADGSVDSTAYLPLGGGTMTGVLFGASASFSGFVGFGGNTSPLAAIDVTGAGRFSSTISAAGATLTGALSGTSATFASGIFNNGANSTDGIKVISTTSSSLFTGGIEFMRTTVSGGSKIQPLRDAAIGGVGLNFLVTTNNTAEVNATYTSALQILNSGAATFSSTLQAGAITSSVATGNGSFYINNASLSNKNWTLIPNTSGAETDLLFFYTGASAGTRMTLTNGGNVGIGTTAPDAQLVINGASNSRFNMRAGDTRYGTLYADNGVFAVASITSIPLVLGTNDTERMRITSGGNVLVGLTSDNGIKFQVSGDTYATGYVYFKNQASSNNFAWYGSTNILLYNSAVGNIASINASTGVYVATSDFNKKKDLEESKIGLNEVMQLKPTLYRMKTDETKGEKELGFIAQDVKGIIPSAYQESGDFIGLNFNPIVAALTKAVQELKAELDTLKNK